LLTIFLLKSILLKWRIVIGNTPGGCPRVTSSRHGASPRGERLSCTARRHRLEAPANEKRGMLLHIKNDEHGELLHSRSAQWNKVSLQTLPQGMRKV